MRQEEQTILPQLKNQANRLATRMHLNKFDITQKLNALKYNPPPAPYRTPRELERLSLMQFSADKKPKSKPGWVPDYALSAKSSSKKRLLFSQPAHGQLNNNSPHCRYRNQQDEYLSIVSGQTPRIYGRGQNRQGYNITSQSSTNMPPELFQTARVLS